jgi:hypothetical protein
MTWSCLRHFLKASRLHDDGDIPLGFIDHDLGNPLAFHLSQAIELADVAEDENGIVICVDAVPGKT